MDSIPLQILVQIALILVNAFFAASEIAVISLNSAVLKSKAEEGDKKAARLLRLNEEPSDFLSTIQIGITLAGFLGSAFAADAFAKYLVEWLVYDLGVTMIPSALLGTISVVVITIILSFFTLIFGELVPKRLAMHNPYAIASFSCGVISFVAWTMKPVIRLLSFCTRMVLRIFGIKDEDGNDEVSEEEIRMMVDIGEKSGTIDKDESEWIQNIFAFDDMEIKEIMTHRTDTVCIAIDDDYDKVVACFKESGLSRLPVYDEDKMDIIGVLYVRDLFLNDQNRDISSLMRKPYFVPETMKADVLFDEMRQEKVHLAIVVDEYGGFSGIITLEDLMEAIVGNIYDEYDKREDAEDVIQLANGEYLISGQAALSEIFDKTKIKLFKEEEANYDTLSGLITGHLNRIPDGAVTLDFAEAEIAVTEVKKHRIEKVIVRPKKTV